MKMKTIGWVVVLWLINLPVAFCDTEVLFLDLTEIQSSKEYCSTARVIGVGQEGVDPSKQKQPIELMVTQSGEKNSSIEGQGLFDITVRNVSARVQVFPLESDLLKIVPGGCKGNQTKLPKGYQHVSVVLRVEEKSKSNRQSLFMHELYGSEEVPGSILRLKPGEWVRSRVRAKTYIPESMNGNEGYFYSLCAEYYLVYAQEDQWDFRNPIRSPSIRVEWKKR